MNKKCFQVQVFEIGQTRFGGIDVNEIYNLKKFLF